MSDYNADDFFAAERKDLTCFIDIPVEVGSWCSANCENFELQETAIFAENMKMITSRKCKWLNLCKNAIELYCGKVE